MLRIVYILTTYPCRSETFIERQIQALQKHGIDIIVLAAEHNSINRTQPSRTFYRPKFSLFEMFKYVIRHPFSLLKLLILFFKFLFTCPREAAVVVGNIHTIFYFIGIVEKLNINHIHSGFLSWPACIGLAVAKLSSRTFSISAHSRDIFVECGAANLKIRHSIFTICCTSDGLEHIKTKLPKRYHSKLYLNHHGIELMNGKVNHRRNNNAPHIIASARLVEKKGFAVLIKSFEAVTNKYPSARLIIAGSGSEDNNLNRCIKEHNLEKNIKMLGWVGHRRLMKLLYDADILVVPSVIDSNGDKDGMPNVILEAFSVGTPVIASRIGGITEVVKDKHTGLLVEPSNIGQLSEAVLKMIEDKATSAKLSENAYELLKAKFDLQKNVQQLAKLFTDTK